MQDATTMIDLIQSSGVVGVLGLIVWAFVTRRLHSDGEYQELREDRDMWRELALGVHDTSRRAVGAAEALASISAREDRRA